MKNGRYEIGYGGFLCKWYKNDLLHREDGPAIEYTNGDQVWWLEGELHREDGPAIDCINGNREWWLHGMRHRESGPAIESTDSFNPERCGKSWWIANQLHREDAPAIEFADGSTEWWIHGIQHTKEEFDKYLEKKALKEKLESNFSEKTSSKLRKI